MRGDPDDVQIERSSLFAAGFCKGWLTACAHSEGIPEFILTERVSQLLRGSGGARPEGRMPDLPIQASGLSERIPEVEGAGRPRGKASRHKTVRGKSPSTGMKGYWAKMSAEERSVEVKRRLKKGRRKPGVDHEVRASRMTPKGRAKLSRLMKQRWASGKMDKGKRKLRLWEKLRKGRKVA